MKVFSPQKLQILGIGILSDFMKALHITLPDQMVLVFSRDEMYAIIGRCTDFIYLVYGCFEQWCLGFLTNGVWVFNCLV